MPTLDVSELLTPERPSAAWAASLVLALARDEAAGRRPARLTEPNLATWNRFRGRLTASDFLALLFEDAAVLHEIPFAARAGLKAELVPAIRAEAWLKALSTFDLTSSSTEYILEQARLLGLPTRMARSDLHVVKPHQRVLELPGTGGQLSHHIATVQPELTLHDNFTIACETWQDWTLAGIIALDRGAPHANFIVPIDNDGLKNPDHPLRQRPFDFVIGLHPEKGGTFRVQDQLAIWYPTAKILLV